MYYRSTMYCFICSVSMGQWRFQESPIILEITMKITQPPVPDTCAMTCHVRNDSSQVASHCLGVSQVCCLTRTPLCTKRLVSRGEADLRDQQSIPPRLEWEEQRSEDLAEKMRQNKEHESDWMRRVWQVLRGIWTG
jgi:hypothetical protein